MFTTTDAGDQEFADDASGAALPRATRGSSSNGKYTPVFVSQAEHMRRRKAEEAEWAAKCGPVTVRKKDDIGS